MNVQVARTCRIRGKLETNKRTQSKGINMIIQPYSYNNLFFKLTKNKITLITSFLCVFVFILPFAFHCKATDRAPDPIEIDTRSDDDLMKAAQAEMLIGKWYGDKGEPIPMIITKRHISYNPECKGTYSIVQLSVARTFPDTSGPPLKVGRWVTIKLKLSPAECIRDRAFFQFSFVTTGSDYSHAAIVEYDTHNNPVAKYSLIKRK